MKDEKQHYHNGFELNGNGSKLNGNGAAVNGGESVSEIEDFLGEAHVGTSKETPMREDAWDLSPEEKIQGIAHHFGKIMDLLGLDRSDDSLSGTPLRVAKMYVNEVFQGLNPDHKPVARMFENKYGYGEMLVEKNITVHSYCEHHFVPINGVAHVAYISNGHVIGLSKINRIVRYFSKRPQVQERLTEQIAQELKQVLQTEDVAVVIDASHMCVSTRGIEDTASTTITSHYSGKFQEEKYKSEFLKHSD